ncbi:MAG TPA: hypothetical protein VIU46_03015 [Gallionellaceae bacterium]
MTARQPTAKKSGARSSSAKKPASSSRATSSAAKPARRSRGAPALPEQGADMPLLPVDQLERLHAIKPDAVDWVIRQTQIEAEHRREETARVNGFILLERLLGQFLALLIGAAGILGGSWVAVNGQPMAGAAIAVSAIAGLTVVYLAAKKSR